MSVDFSVIQEELSNALGCENSVGHILSAMTVTRPPTRGYEPPSEYKVTPSNFKPWVTLYIAKREGISPDDIAAKVFDAIETKRGKKLTSDQKKAYFATAGTINGNLRYLGKEELVVTPPKIKGSKKTAKASGDITVASLGLEDLFS